MADGLWLKNIPSFDRPCFELNAYHDFRRREVLFAVARRGEIISHFEARGIPPDELLAMAVEEEDIAWNERKDGRDVRTGSTAEGGVITDTSVVYVVPDVSDVVAPVGAYTIQRSTAHGFIIEIDNGFERRTIPTRMVFLSEAAAEFARREYIAFSVAPEARSIDG